MNANASDVEVALSAASSGAAVVRAAYGEEVTRHSKSGLDFATDVDLRAERAILAIIADARPRDLRIGEETGSSGNWNPRRWLVDPLCGTLNFAVQTPLTAVNVALLDGDMRLASVCADPIADELFWTDGRGAFRRRRGMDDPLRPRGESQLVDVNCDGPTDGTFVGPQLVADATFRTAFAARVTSTTLAVAWVAAGRRAGYVSDGLFTDNVHFAAGIGLCVAAGCIVTDFGGEPLESDRGLVVAADAETHSRLIEIIRPHVSDLRA